MTDQPKNAIVQVPKGSRLESLLEAYAQAKPAADAAAERLKVITDGIKAEVQAAAPGARSIVAATADVAINVVYVEQWRIDSKRLKAEDPHTYVRWARKVGSWQVRKAASS